MNKLLFIIAIAFTGCTYNSDTYISKMKSPVTIVGINRYGDGVYVTVKDKTGTVFSMSDDYTAISLEHSKVGDTIK